MMLWERVEGVRESFSPEVLEEEFDVEYAERLLAWRACRKNSAANKPTFHQAPYGHSHH